jgi:hypothetical protein
LESVVVPKYTIGSPFIHLDINAACYRSRFFFIIRSHITQSRSYFGTGSPHRVQTCACGQRSRVHLARMSAMQRHVGIGPMYGRTVTTSSAKRPRRCFRSTA